MLTVKELADKLDVTPMTIHRNKPKNMEFTQKAKINYIDEELEKAITEKVKQNQKIYSKKKSVKEDKVNSNSELIDQLRQEIQYLRKQIEVKDNQLERKDKLLDQQQQLNLKTMTKLEEIDQPKEESTEKETEQQEESETEEQPKGIFAKWFGK